MTLSLIHASIEGGSTVDGINASSCIICIVSSTHLLHLTFLRPPAPARLHHGRRAPPVCSGDDGPSRLVLHHHQPAGLIM